MNQGHPEIQILGLFKIPTLPELGTCVLVLVLKRVLNAQTEKIFQDILIQVIQSDLFLSSVSRSSGHVNSPS